MNKNSIKEAARIAGVSVASVSRALNDKPGISEKTKARIIEICNQLGYQPSDAARRLKIGKSNHVGLAIGRADKIHSHYISSLFERLNSLLTEESFVLNIYPFEKLDTLLKDSSAAIVTGIEENDIRLSRLKEAEIPFVTIGKTPEDFWVCPDDYQGGELAAKHLLELGCKSFLVVESAMMGKGTKARTIGFQKCLQEEGYLSSQLYIEELNAIELQTYRTVTKMLKNNRSSFDAIFCENDDIAYGALTACEDFGLLVPEEVKIVGFDDLPGVFERITTVRQDIELIAKSAVDLLNQAKQKLPVTNKLLPVSLIKRESTIKGG